jgi:hypothetical protein
MKSFLTLILACLFAVAAFGADTNQPMFCTAAKKEVKTCCCEMKDGKSYCKLTGKTFDKCCCIPKKEKKTS